MIYRGFITANSPRTVAAAAAADAGENLPVVREKKEKEKREREREPRATPPTSHLLRVSSYDVGMWGPFWAGPSKRPVRRRQGAFSGTFFPLFVLWNMLTPKRGSRSRRARYIRQRFNSGTMRLHEFFRSYKKQRFSITMMRAIVIHILSAY